MITSSLAPTFITAMEKPELLDNIISTDKLTENDNIFDKFLEDFFANNSILYILNGLGNLTNLTKLSCSVNELRYLPNSIINSTSLTELNFETSLLESLPLRFIKLPKLNDLMLYNTSLAIKLNIAKNSSEAEDFFANNSILCIPKDTYEYKENYKNGIFSAFNIEILPESISALSTLTSLDLFFCPNLTRLPNGLGYLTNLTKLSCSANELRYIPNSIINLTNLTELNLNTSLLEILPLSFLKLPKLKNLMLYGTPLAIKLKIAKNSTEAIDSTELKIVTEYIEEYAHCCKKYCLLKIFFFKNNIEKIVLESIFQYYLIAIQKNWR